MVSLRRWFAWSLLLGASSFLPITAVGCSSDDGSSAQTGEGDEIVNVPHTEVKNQSIGNCWTYASIGWAESLHLQATGEALNLSESYLTYWDWYEKLIREPGSEKLSTGGWFQTAVKVFDRYGLLDEGVFIPEEATSARSSAQSRAESAINTSMTSGRLKTDRSPRTVREELNAAWGLKPEVVSALNAVFGDSTPRTLSPSTQLPAGFPLRRSTDLVVTSKRPNQAATSAKLKDVSGRWQEVPVPTSASARRAYFRRVQKALHDAQPVIIIWDVSWGSRNSVAGTFPAMKADAKIDGRHMTLLEDYQAINVPNLGLLPAGVTLDPSKSDDKKKLDAALANQTAIQFFRIKNSWGQSGDPTNTGQFKGYADLYMDYLLPTNGAPKGLVSFILPTDYTDALPSGVEPERCASQTDGDHCGSKLSSNESDRRVLSCKGGVTASVLSCDGACDKATATCTIAPPPPPLNPCADIGVDVPGLYCGDTLALLPGEPGYDTLFSCQIDPTTGKWISPGTPCANGCAPQPPDVADRCN